MKKVLLTGASGFIGSHSLPLLVERGFEVHAVGRAQRPPFVEGDLLFWHQCDLLDLNDQNTLMSRVKPTHLLHFAWHALPKDYWDSLENIRWVQASLELLLRFSSQGGRRAVLAGTCAEYDWTHGYCIESVTPEKPSSLYGVSKSSLQTILRQLSKTTGLSSAWGRIFHLYGPGEHPERLVPSVIISLLNGKLAHCSHGEQIRDFLFVKDAASAFVELLDSDIQGTVNVASGEPVSLKKIVGWLGDYLGCPELIEFGSIPARASDPPFLVASVERLARELHWRPEYPLHRGLEQTVSWWKQSLRKRGGVT